MEIHKFGDWNKNQEDIFHAQYPMHAACRNGDDVLLDRLLKDGQHSIYEEDGFYGWTPANFAAYFGMFKCLMRLTESKVNCDYAVPRFSQTPAHCAAFANSLLCLKWLVHLGASLQRRDYLGETALHKAARAGATECCSLLVAQGAMLSIRNSSGQTAAELAARLGHLHVAASLDQAAGIGLTDFPLQQVLEIGRTDVPLQHGQGLNGGLLPPAQATPQLDVDMEEMEVVQPIAEVDFPLSAEQGRHARKRNFGQPLTDENQESWKRSRTATHRHGWNVTKDRASVDSFQNSSAAEHLSSLVAECGYDSAFFKQ